ncbi:MAG: MBL fold metallo-hydrolase [Bacteroidales bacterium]
MQNHILRIKTGASNVYLIENGESSILVDSGNRKKSGKILTEIQKYDINPADVAAILLTHAHYDHAGSLSELKKMTGAKVYAHAAEEELLRKGSSGFPDGTSPFFRFIVGLGRTFYKKLGAFESVEPDTLIQDKYDLNEFGLDAYILPTPGHTKGSVSLILNSTYAFIGDTAFNIRKKSVYPPFANDEKLLIQSWKALLDTGAEYFYPGHGNVFNRSRLLKNYRALHE